MNRFSLKHVLVGLLALLIALPSAAGVAVAEPASQAAMPALELVPLRPVAEAAGATVTWDGATSTVTVTRGAVTLVVKVGEGVAAVNGVPVPIGAPVTLENGRAMMPLPFLKAVLGVEVRWDPAAGKAVLDETANRALEFARALVAGKLDKTWLTPAFAAAMPEPRMAAIAAQLQQMGALAQVGVLAHNRNAVHENVQLVLVLGKTAWDLTVRFSPDGKLVDDYYMNVYMGPVPVAGAAPYVVPANFTEQEVIVGEGGAFPLPGTLAMPKGAGPFPVLVLVHGSGPNDRDESVGGVKTFRDLAQGLASKGVAVLRYEKRTREHSQKSVMVPGFGLQAETIADALEAVKYVRGLDRINPNRIFVLGHSQGGYAVPYIIGQDKEQFLAGGIIAAGPNDFLQAILDQNRLMVEAKLLPDAQLPFIHQQVAMLRDPSFDAKKPPQGFALGMPQYFLDLRTPVAPVALKQGLPLMILQGARDFQVPASQLESWQKELADRPGMTYKLYPKLNHIFTEGEGPLGFLDEYQTPANVPAYVIDDIAKWVRDH